VASYQVTIDFPILADPTREIATLYGMLDPALEDKSGLPLTCRAVSACSQRGPEDQASGGWRAGWTQQCT
jgi:hypothetical protein